MTIIEQDIISEIIDNIFFNDGTSVKSRASKPVIKDLNLGFSVDITDLEMHHAQEVRSEVVKRINAVIRFEKISIVLTSSRRTPETKAIQQPKLHIEGVKNIYLIASGKGGVGKSTVTALIAYKLLGLGKRVGIVDADIYGPSIPNIFGVNSMPEIVDKRMVALQSHGIKLNSIGFISAPTSSISWRGPMAGKALYQLLSLTNWGELDYLIIDSPPGTGDIHLSLLQNYNIDQVFAVTTPQKISTTDVARALNLYKKFGVHIAGIIENMSHYIDPKTNEQIKIFSGNGGEKLSADFNIPLIAQIPVLPELSVRCDAGEDLSNFIYLLPQLGIAK